MNLNKEININKKFIVLFLLVNIVALCFYYSYALFQVNVIKNNAIVINTSSSLPSITTTIDDTTLNTFTLSANSNKTVSVKITASTTSAMAYKMYYDVEGYGTFRVTSTESFPNNLVEGTFTNMKTISLTFTNSSSSDLTIILGAVGGFESTGATLNGQTELILNQDITIKEPPIRIKSNNTSSSCQNAKLTYKEDGIIYLSGSSDCIDFNYLWYSGKMWRITAIYPDGAMKMVTDNNITSIAFNALNQVNFYTNENTTSYMYQWLNEDFYDTLYNASNIIDTTKSWNATRVEGSDISVKPGNTNLVTANVGLLNSYEYYNSYRNLGSYGSGYLNNGHGWWLLNPYSLSKVHDNSSVGINVTNGNGVRPSICLKSGVSLTGIGSKTAPYKIVGDKEAGTENQMINTRISGEYVKIKYIDTSQVEQLSSLYRIVGTENDANGLLSTKIVSIEYADNGTKKNFASSSTFGESTNTQSTNYWDYYLNNDWYTNLVTNCGDKFTTGLYYIGFVSSRSNNPNYKQSICSSNTSYKITDCEKLTPFDFKVGLLRIGEMFASEWGNQNSYIITNHYETYQVGLLQYSGRLGSSEVSSNYAVHPTIHLKSTVKILSGSGTELDPYVVGL